jgi:hypothetical protein
MKRAVGVRSEAEGALDRQLVEIFQTFADAVGKVVQKQAV